MNNIYKTIYNEIKKYKTIYIARHIGPDPDAFGSQVGLRDSIRLTFPDKEVYAVGTTVSRFKYFGKIDKITKYDYENALLIVVDTPDNKRVDIDEFLSFKNVIKIDHHPKVDTFGKVELICEEASSASELVFELIENTKLKMSESIGFSLLCGIVSDTNRFLFNMNSNTLNNVSSLLKKYKVDVDKVYTSVYSKPLNEVRLMGHIASTLKVNKHGFAFIEIDEGILNSLGADASAASNMINDFNNINEVIVWVFITYNESTGLYKLNIRSRGPVVNELAAKYGGGGHKYASGLRTQNKEDVDNLLNDLSEACREYSEGRDKNGSN